MSVLKVKQNGTWERVSGISQHTHTIDDITNLPDIKPDGGDADTVDGKHASDFALASDMFSVDESIAALRTLIGDETVASQIASAIISKANAEHSHGIADIDSLYDVLLNKYSKPSTGIPNSDLDSAVQTALNKANTAIQSLNGYATESYVADKISDLVNSSPATLDTLQELAAALGDDPNFATTIASQIGEKVDKVAGKGLSTNDYTTQDKEMLASASSGVTNLQSLVGDQSVATQIAEAVKTKSDAGHDHNNAYDEIGAAAAALESAKQYTNGEIAKMSQIQIITWEADD